MVLEALGIVSYTLAILSLGISIEKYAQRIEKSFEHTLDDSTDNDISEKDNRKNNRH